MAPRKAQPAPSTHSMRTRARGSASPPRDLPPNRVYKPRGAAGTKKSTTKKTTGGTGKKRERGARNSKADGTSNGDGDEQNGDTSAAGSSIPAPSGGAPDQPSKPASQPSAADSGYAQDFARVNQNPCQWAERLRRQKQQEAGTTGVQTHTVQGNQLLHDDSLLLAIASVQEAVNTKLAFSLLDVGTYTGARSAFYSRVSRALRPRCTLLLPWAVSEKDYVDPKVVGEHSEQLDAGGHFFLVQVSIPKTIVNPLGLPVVRIYDSMPRFLLAQRAKILDHIYRYIERIQWYYGPGIHERVRFAGVQWIDVTHQEDSISCGIHTILNAWIIAAGLTLANPPPQTLSASFNAEATKLINLALAGHLNFWALYAFLRCYGLVQEVTSTIDSPTVRLFPRTVAMVDSNTLRNLYEAQKRTEEITMLRATPITEPGVIPENLPWGTASVDDLRARLMAYARDVPRSPNELRFQYDILQTELDSLVDIPDSDSFILQVFDEYLGEEGVHLGADAEDLREVYENFKDSMRAEQETVRARRARVARNPPRITITRKR